MLPHAASLAVPTPQLTLVAAAPRRTGRRDLTPVRDWLHAHVTEPVSLAQLARLAGLSKYHFLRAFTRTFGMTPHDYQMELRLELARALIVQGRPLSFVAYDAGFSDQSHLTRRFKQRYGCTPGAFARAPLEESRVA